MLALLFRCNERYCAVRVAGVRSVLHVVEAHDGAIDWRGERLPLVDMERLVTGQPAPALRSTRMFICERVALLAPYATDAVEITAVSPPPADAPAFVEGVFGSEGRDVWLVDPATLID